MILYEAYASAHCVTERGGGKQRHNLNDNYTNHREIVGFRFCTPPANRQATLTSTRSGRRCHNGTHTHNTAEEHSLWKFSRRFFYRFFLLSLIFLFPNHFCSIFNCLFGQQINCAQHFHFRYLLDYTLVAVRVRLTFCLFALRWCNTFGWYCHRHRRKRASKEIVKINIQHNVYSGFFFQLSNVHALKPMCRAVVYICPCRIGTKNNYPLPICLKWTLLLLQISSVE